MPLGFEVVWDTTFEVPLALWVMVQKLQHIYILMFSDVFRVLPFKSISFWCALDAYLWGYVLRPSFWDIPNVWPEVPARKFDQKFVLKNLQDAESGIGSVAKVLFQTRKICKRFCRINWISVSHDLSNILDLPPHPVTVTVTTRIITCLQAIPINLHLWLLLAGR